LNSLDLREFYNEKQWKFYNAGNQYYTNKIFMCKSEPNTGVGYINLNVITGLENAPLPQANVTIYVRQGSDKEIPIMWITTTLNSILVQLPVSYSPETLIKGPEYAFSNYNIKVAAEGYYTTRIINIRMFPEITTDFNINMIPVIRENPNHEQIIVLPPHPRDTIID